MGRHRGRPSDVAAIAVVWRLVTADALDALGRADEAKALRARYGVETKAN